jgi:hypothetical protein
MTPATSASPTTYGHSHDRLSNPLPASGGRPWSYFLIDLARQYGGELVREAFHADADLADIG